MPPAAQASPSRAPRCLPGGEDAACDTRRAAPPGAPRCRPAGTMRAEGADHSMINLSVQQVLSLWAHGTVLRNLTGKVRGGGSGGDPLTPRVFWASEPSARCRPLLEHARVASVSRLDYSSRLCHLTPPPRAPHAHTRVHTHIYTLSLLLAVSIIFILSFLV